MKFLGSIFGIVCALASPAATPSNDSALEIAAKEKQIEEIRQRVCPSSGETETDVELRFGVPRGKTTPEVEAQNGRYDVDEIGLYRWFYRTDVFEIEEATGLQTVFPVEMVVYFVGRRVVGSTLEISPQNARRYISSDGVVESYSGSPPVLRRKSNGTLAFDYHVAEGTLRTRLQLLRMLRSYEAWLQRRKNLPNKAPEPTTTAVTPRAP